MTLRLLIFHKYFHHLVHLSSLLSSFFFLITRSLPLRHLLAVQNLIAYLITSDSNQGTIKMIDSLLLLLCLALSALGQGFIHAPVITNNPPTTYTATLFNNPSTSIRGSVTASGAPDGVGLVFRVNFTGLPAGLGPFSMILSLNS